MSLDSIYRMLKTVQDTCKTLVSTHGACVCASGQVRSDMNPIDTIEKHNS